MGGACSTYAENVTPYNILVRKPEMKSTWEN